MANGCFVNLKRYLTVMAKMVTRNIISLEQKIIEMSFTIIEVIFRISLLLICMNMKDTLKNLNLLIMYVDYEERFALARCGVKLLEIFLGGLVFLCQILINDLLL